MHICPDEINAALAIIPHLSSHLFSWVRMVRDSAINLLLTTKFN